MATFYSYDPNRAVISLGEKEYPLYTGTVHPHPFMYRILAFHEGKISLQDLYTDLLILEKER